MAAKSDPSKEAIRYLADRLYDLLRSPNVPDSNWEPANIVDVVDRAGRGIHRLAESIKPDAAPGRDAGGGQVGSLTEAAMGITSGLFRIAESIESLADAIRERT